MQTKYHQVVIPILLAAMDDRGSPRVQTHGAAALVNFAEDTPKSVITPYLDSILSKVRPVFIIIPIQEKPKTNTLFHLRKIAPRVD